jgi:hypothetical protein
MGSTYEEITPKLQTWIAQQRMFFVATAPLSAEGHVSCSPKGLDSFRILGPHSVAYLDLTGSGIETVAHLRENGRIVLMFCAFEGPPRIVRLHGRGTVLTPGEPAFDDLRSRFSDMAGVRGLIHVDVTRVSDACGYGVPLFQFVRNRDQLERSFAVKGEAGLAAYRQTKNANSIDGLPGLDSSGHRDEIA